MTLLTKDKFYSFVQDYERLTSSSAKTADNIMSVCQRVEEFIPVDSPADAWNIQLIVDKYAEISALSDDSKRSYLSRLNSAISKFIAYEKGDDVTTKTKRPRTSGNNVSNKQPEAKEINTFSLPIPLRDGFIIRIENLPMDLSSDEADRIATIIKSFAVK